MQNALFDSESVYASHSPVIMRNNTMNRLSVEIHILSQIVKNEFRLAVISFIYLFESDINAIFRIFNSDIVIFRTNKFVKSRFKMFPCPLEL